MQREEREGKIWKSIQIAKIYQKRSKQMEMQEKWLFAPLHCRVLRQSSKHFQTVFEQFHDVQEKVASDLSTALLYPLKKKKLLLFVLVLFLFLLSVFFLIVFLRSLVSLFLLLLICDCVSGIISSSSSPLSHLSLFLGLSAAVFAPAHSHAPPPVHSSCSSFSSLIKLLLVALVVHSITLHTR